MTAASAASLITGTTRRCSTGRNPPNTAGSGPGMPGREYRVPAARRARTGQSRRDAGNTASRQNTIASYQGRW
jgi:hypothetical protein